MSGPQIRGGSICYSPKLRQRGTTGYLDTTLKARHEYIVKVLGVLKPGGRLPKLSEVFLMEAQIGWFGGDDIIECLGQDVFDKLANYVMSKYEGKLDAAEAADRPQPPNGT